MGLQKHTVTSVDNDSTISGVRLFNGDYIHSLFSQGSNVWLFYKDYGASETVLYNKYLIDDTLENVQGLYDEPSVQYLTLTRYNSMVDDALGTKEVLVDVADIMYGLDISSTDCVLYIRSGGAVDKVRFNTTVTDIDDDTSAPVPTDFSSWFLPSRDEVKAMYDNLYLEGVGNFKTDTTYVTSRESTSLNMTTISMFNGSEGSASKGSTAFPVRAARTFTAASGDYSLRDVGPGGGLIFYVDGTTYYEAAENDISDGYYWSNITNVAIGTTGTAIGTGLANTAAIIAQDGHTDSAALLCSNYTV